MQSVKEALTLDKVRKLLKWWGEYQRAVSSAGYRIGWMSSSPCIHIGETRTPPITVPQPAPIVLKIDDSMQVLSAFRADWYMSLRFKYEFERTNKDAAASMKIGIDVYKRWVNEGEGFIAGRIA